MPEITVLAVEIATSKSLGSGGGREGFRKIQKESEKHGNGKVYRLLQLYSHSNLWTCYLIAGGSNFTEYL